MTLPESSKNEKKGPAVVESGFVDSLWQFFASIRLTVVVLLLLAALSIIGTLIPQNQNPMDYLRAFGPFFGRVLFTLHLYDMYHSWWFQGLIVLLAVNIIVCSIDRLQSTWRIIFPEKQTFNLESFRKRKSKLEFVIDRPSAMIRSGFEGYLKKAFSYCETFDVENGFAVAAEKGRWTRLGVYIVHLSVVVLLVGGLIGSKFGFEGYVNIPEGQTVDTIELRHTGQALRLPFAIRCDDFDVQFYEGGSRPKEFRSSLTILENDQVSLQKDIIVNDPLRYKGINIFQSSYGKLQSGNGMGQIPDKMPDKVELNFQSADSGMTYTLTGRIGQTLNLPEGLGTFTLQSYEQQASFKEMALGPAYRAVLVPEKGQGDPVNVLLPIRFPRFDAMRGGNMIVSVIAPQQPRQTHYYTGLQVTYDPGVWLVYFGFIMMIGGCAITFFMSHQRLVILVQLDEKDARVVVSGTANKGKYAFQQTRERIAERLTAIGEADAGK